MLKVEFDAGHLSANESAALEVTYQLFAINFCLAFELEQRDRERRAKGGKRRAPRRRSADEVKDDATMAYFRVVREFMAHLNPRLTGLQ